MADEPHAEIPRLETMDNTSEESSSSEDDHSETDRNIKVKNERAIVIQPQLNILAEHNDIIKINEKFILKLTKERENVNNKMKNDCKVLHFSSEWTFKEVLEKIERLDHKEYPQLFIFVINIKELVFGAQKAKEITNEPPNKKTKVGHDIHKLKDSLQNLCGTRPIILQLISEDEKMTKIYYKEEKSNEFIVIDHQQDESEYSSTFSSFLLSFFNGKFYNSEIEILNAFQEFENCSLILRFVQTLQLSDGFFGALVLNRVTEGSKAEFLAALDSPFENNGRMLSNRAQKYISDVFGDDDPENDTSVLLTAIENENTEVIDYLITYWTHLIQQLPFDHQVKISTAAFESNQLDVLCDLLDIADFPFPDNFKPESIEHERLRKIIAERIDFKTAIEREDFEKIDEFINNNSNLKFIHNLSNNTALTESVYLKRFGVFYYLKSIGFQDEKCDEVLENLGKEEKEKAVKLATHQRRKNIYKSEDVVPRSVMLLSMRSSVHNSRTEKIQASKYRDKIMKWFTDIHKVAPELIEVAASCNNLRIVFDFESDSVENMSLTGSNASGSMYPSSRWIFVGAKLSDRNGNVNKQRKQKIKGVLAHELCHYVMRLIYENQGKPYYTDREYMKEMFEEIVKIIDKWSSEDSTGPDDECNGIISSVFKLYDPKDFPPELIVRVVQILAEYDDNEAHLGQLQQKYEILFYFWLGQVIPELQKYLQKNQEIIRLNERFGLLPSITKLKYELKDKKEMENVMKDKLVIVQTNVPNFLFINIRKYLQQKYGQFFKSKNIFTKPLELKIKEVWDDFKEICSDKNELKIFVDCTCEIPNYLENILFNENTSLIFVVTHADQTKQLMKIFDSKKIKIDAKMQISYKLSNLTEKSKKLLLQSKINFQNNSEVSLMDLLRDEKVTRIETYDLAQIIDDEILNMLVGNQEVSVNTKLEKLSNEEDFKIIFQTRQFLKKRKDVKNQPDVLKCSNHMKHKKEDFLIISQEKLLLEVKKQQFVLLSDQAGNGKSWVMKNIVKTLREQNPTSWVTYVDLKQFIDEFKTQNGEPEFSSFIVEKILKIHPEKFEAKIFNKLYKNGKVFILFDGFDEIAPNCAEFVSKSAQNFQSNGGNQLWIATRDHFEVDLKEKLKLDVAYSLDEMTEKEGIDLIARIWVLTDLKEQKNEPKSKEDFKECIKKSARYESYQQKAHQLVKKALSLEYRSIGMPILLKIIAVDFKDVDNANDEDLSKIFKKFIQIISSKGNKLQDCSKLNKVHQFFAVRNEYPELSEIFHHDCNEIELSKEEIITNGLVTINNGQIYFPHEILRQCCVADFIVMCLTETQHGLNTKPESLSKNDCFNTKICCILTDILTVQKYDTIRILLNDFLENSSVLIKWLPHIENFMENFYEIEHFEGFFAMNLKNLVDFVIAVLKKGKYEKIKPLLYKWTYKIIQITKSSLIFMKFQAFLFKFLEKHDLEKLIEENKIFHNLSESNLSAKVFSNFLKQTKENISNDIVRKNLKTLSHRSKNIFEYLCWSSFLDFEKVVDYLKVISQYLDRPEIIELMVKCNNYDQNILQIVIRTGDKNKLISVWTEVKKFLEQEPQTFKELVTSEAIFGRNILHYAAYCDDLEFHETLWTLLSSTFTDPEELRKLLVNNDRLTDNFARYLVESKKSAEIMELTFKILKQKLGDDEFRKILTSRNQQERNLLMIASIRSTDIKTHQVLWENFKSEAKFHEIIEQVDDDGCNVFHLAASSSSADNFEYILSKCPEKKVKELLKNVDKNLSNVLQTATKANKSLKLHESLWSTIQKYFNNLEITDMIKNVNQNGENLFFIAIQHNTKEVVEFTWNLIKNVSSKNDQIDLLWKNRKCINFHEISSQKLGYDGVYDSVQDILKEYGM